MKKDKREIPKPPVPPPSRTMMCSFFGYYETEESKYKTYLWTHDKEKYIATYINSTPEEKQKKTFCQKLISIFS